MQKEINMSIFWLSVFWVMYAITFVIFKFGTTKPSRKLPCFIAGNVFGVSATWVLMMLYRTMNANIALGLCLGGGFVISQLALALIFRSNLKPLQYAGALTVALGIFVMVVGGNT
jgi:multidrug transporter EmrE-like cation transporter